ncbi:MAG: sigma-54-dependent Fis family transcriptional regulator, partial [Ekhidna sp.]|nr:sigma-54-dependent Fis family transcriptional regulator [Ekhidna sp.]
NKVGLMETANLGTLLMDEIGGLPLHLQSKLLAALENRTINRVGEHQPRAIDIRLISTSHKAINDLNDPLHFRQDLLFRVNTVHIEIPPLRHRKEDIKDLVNHFLTQFNSKYERSLNLSKSQLMNLIDYEWPGNVRELKNSLERMVIMESGDSSLPSSGTKQNEDNLYEVEKRKIEEIIERHAGNISRAASELGIGRNTLYRKMKKYGI